MCLNQLYEYSCKDVTNREKSPHKKSSLFLCVYILIAQPHAILFGSILSIHFTSLPPVGAAPSLSLSHGAPLQNLCARLVCQRTLRNQGFNFVHPVH